MNASLETGADVASWIALSATDCLMFKDRYSRMARILMKHMDNRETLEEMGAKARKMGKRDAAKVIVDHVMKMIEEKSV